MHPQKITTSHHNTPTLSTPKTLAANTVIKNKPLHQRGSNFKFSKEVVYHERDGVDPALQGQDARAAPHGHGATAPAQPQL